MKRPDTPALLAAISFGGLQLAVFLALVPLAPNDALADSARLGEERAEAPLQDLGGLAANAPADAATADPGPAEAAPAAKAAKEKPPTWEKTSNTRAPFDRRAANS